MTFIVRETRNVLRASISMLILFSAILSLEFMQEPLLAGLSMAGIGGIRHSDGYLSLCLVYLFNTISCPLAPYMVTRMTGKWAMVAAMVVTLGFQATFLLPNRVLLLVTSCFVGISITFLWVGQGQYITENVSKENMEKNTSMQWAFFKMSLIVGGVFFLLFFEDSSIQDIVTNGQMSMFIYIFMTCTLLSIINTSCLSQSEMSQNRVQMPFYQTTVDCLKLLKTSRMLLLALFFFYTGLVRSFWISIYPACIKFTTTLSLNTTSLLSIGMIVTGVGQVLGSAIISLFGKKIRRIGKHMLVLFGLSIHVVLFVLIAMSFPNEAPLGHTDKLGPVFHTSVFSSMAISGLLGFADAILQTQVYAYIAEYYQKESSSVFSIFRFFSGIASTIMFFGAQFVLLVFHSTMLSIFAILAGFAVLGIERVRRNEKKSSVILVQVIHSPR